MHRDYPKSGKQQRATSNDEKRERSGTDMSSLVTGSQVSEQTDSKISAVADTQED